jgi:iron-sulfur cluster repair protein YtfE (RIC family)
MKKGNLIRQNFLLNKNIIPHIIPNIVKISLKRVEINFCPGSKNSIIGKTQRKPQDMTELSTNYVTFTKFH